MEEIEEIMDDEDEKIYNDPYIAGMIVTERMAANFNFDHTVFELDISDDIVSITGYTQTNSNKISVTPHNINVNVNPESWLRLANIIRNELRTNYDMTTKKTKGYIKGCIVKAARTRTINTYNRLAQAINWNSVD